MAFKLTTSKETALKAFLNEWAKDPEQYCNYCGWIYVKPPEGYPDEPCCEKPHIGTNLTFLWLLIHENKTLRETRNNKFASNEEKNLRWGLSITPRLLHDMEDYCIHTLKEPFLRDKDEMDAFMRSFPQFRTCEVI